MVTEVLSNVIIMKNIFKMFIFLNSILKQTEDTTTNFLFNFNVSIRNKIW